MHDDKRRVIGKLISVAADLFVVEMNAGTDNFTVVGFDDIHYVARLGTFVAIPVKTDYVIAEVVGLRERDNAAPKKNGDDLEKASSAKYLDVIPVGMLPQKVSGEFRFGVSTFPSLYADAMYVLESELDRIFETANPSEPIQGKEPNSDYKALSIGSSVIFDGYDVKVLVDEFFGGHAAVLGNTGSGKSCTVATIIQSLFAKPDEYKARGASFLVFDVNGEYDAAFKALPEQNIGVATLKLDGTAQAGMFRLPHWFLDMSEWELLLQASERTQLPILRAALGLTSVLGKSDKKSKEVRKHVLAKCVLGAFTSQDGAVGKRQRIVGLLGRYGCDDLTGELVTDLGYDAKYGNFTPSQNEDKFLELIKGHILDDFELPGYNNGPFSFDVLGECLDLALLYEESQGNSQIRVYCAQMLTRFQSLCAREDYEFLRYQIGSGDSIPSGESYLLQLLGLDKKKSRYLKQQQVVVLDMNEVEDEVVELVSSVVARMIFRQLRKADPRNSFPVHCVLEEAHRYIAERPATHAIDAVRIFERIAKEGRKYGMFLIVASQRPSELSKSVLSQCSNFVVHRIQNPDDLQQIRQMTPFISEGVLRRLPSLPKQHALVFGNAVRLPTTFKVRRADPKPHSDDSHIRGLWFHEAGKAALIRLQ
ncbi:MAG: ATP-binding protein [Burkholderiales bacterium]|nr:ATP-binding protein [Burkholderiales bacterium]